MNEGHLEALRDIVGRRHVLTDADVTAGYAVDWTGRYQGSTPAVVRPGAVDEVAGVIAYCAAHGLAVVPQGGNTGLVGGSVPLAGELVLSLRRLDAVGEIDVASARVTAGAGATLAAVHAAADGAGLAFGVDLAARDSATVGGMVATNAGGLHVIRHGSMRQQVVGVQAVLGDGSVVSRLTGVEKDNTGYDLAGLLCGSEGTLGVVTAARLRLVPRVDQRVAALASFATVDDALRALAALRGTVVLEAAEIMFATGVAAVARHLGVSPPLDGAAPVCVLFEWAGDDPAPLEAAAPVDAVVADDAIRRQSLWRLRDAHTEAVSALGVPHKLDVSVPLGELGDFVAEMEGLAASAGHVAVIFGHLAEGNIHVNIVGPAADDDSIDDAVLRSVASRGGSISAEHGIGTAKRQWLPLVRSASELAAFRAIKGALDPAGVLNPAVLSPLTGEASTG